MTTASEVDPLKEPFWNLFQVLAWMLTKDLEWVAKYSDRVTDYGSRLVKHRLPPDGEEREVEMPYDRPSLIRIQTQGDFKAVEKELLSRIEDGSVVAEAESGSIPPSRVLGLSVVELDKGGTRIGLRSKLGNELWTDIRFRRQQVLQVWHAPVTASATTVPPVEQKTKLSDARADELVREYLKQNSRHPNQIEAERVAADLGYAKPRDAMRAAVARATDGRGPGKPRKTNRT